MTKIPETRIPAPKADRRPGAPWAPVAIGLVALAVRLVHLSQINGTPLTGLLVLDSETYDRFARLILAGQFHGEQVYSVNVLYPYFLAAVYSFAKGSLLAVLAFQAVLDALSCVLTWWLGRRLFGETAGLIAGAALAVYGPLVFYVGALLTPTLITFLGLVAIACLVAWQARPRAAWLVGAGVAIGLAALARGNNALYVPLAWFVFASASTSRRAAARSWLVFAAAAAVPVAVVAARNFAVEGQFVPIAANYAAFYVGHNPSATGLYALPPFITSADYQSEVWGMKDAIARHVGHPMTLAESARWLFDQGVLFAVTQPAAELRLFLIKFAYFWNGVEPPTNLSYHFARDYSSLLRALPLGFGVLAPFGLVGMFLARRAWRLLLPLYLWVAIALVTALAFFVSAEYRLPVVPALAVFAAHAVVVLAGLVRRVGARAETPALPARGLALGTVVVLLVLCNLRPPLLASQVLRRADYVNFGSLYERRGDMGRAESMYKQAVAIDPAYRPGYEALAGLYLRTGNASGAAAMGQTVRRLGGGTGLPPVPGASGSAIAQDSVLAVGALFQRGEYAAALAGFERLYARSVAAGDSVSALGLLNNMGLCRLRLGHVDGAGAAFEQVLAQKPDYVKALVNLGRVRAAQGRKAEARALFERALAIEPGNSLAREGLAKE